MSKPGRRKEERKRQKERGREQKQREFERRKNTLKQFPEIIYREAQAPPALVKAVKEAARDAVLEHERLMPAQMAEWYQRIRTDGGASVIRDIREKAVEKGAPILGTKQTLLEMDFLLSLGTLIVSKLSYEVKEAYFPFHDLQVFPGRPKPNQILVEFHSLQQTKTPGGTAYNSPHKPQIEIAGQQKTVAFYRHAAQRISERAVGDWRSYAGLGDAFAYMYHCVYFEPCVLKGHDLAFAVFNECTEGFFSWHYPEKLLPQIDPDTKYCYRVGYCPVALAGDLAVAITMLIPGMEGTPEWDAVGRHQAKSTVEREDLRKKVEQMTLAGLARNPDFSLIKEFHDAGIAQVLPAPDRPLFRRT